MKLYEYIKNRWMAFGIILFVFGAFIFIRDANKKNEKYENCKCGETMYLKKDYELHLSKGYVTFKCYFCKKETNHDVQKSRVYLKPTCTTEGYEKFTYTCIEVSWFSHEETINLGFAEHNFVVHNLGVKPTCTEGGISDFEICTACNLSRGGEDLEPLGHSLVTIERINPTCTEYGHTEVIKCENCSYIDDYGSDIDPLDHDYITEVTAPTYNTDGYTDYKCSRCDESHKYDYVDCLFSNYCTYGLDESNNRINLYSLNSEVEELIVPETINGYPVTHIKNYFSCGVFDRKENTTLKKVVLPDTIKYIGEQAFYKCTALEEINFPENLTTIDTKAFYECTSLTKISLPKKLTEIGQYGFANCSSLKEVIINNGGTYKESGTFIQTGAFDRCDALEIVYFKGDKEKWSNMKINPSNNCLKNTSIYFYSEVNPSVEGNYWHYDSDEFTPVVW